MVTNPVIHVITWPGWLTHSGYFTHKAITCQPYIRGRSGKVWPANKRPTSSPLSCQPQPYFGSLISPSAECTTYLNLYPLHSYQIIQQPPFFRCRDFPCFHHYHLSITCNLRLSYKTTANSNSYKRFEEVKRELLTEWGTFRRGRGPDERAMVLLYDW